MTDSSPEPASRSGTFSAEDEAHLRRALELARQATALASPNPLVGAVVVRNGRVAGEAFHTWDGLAHAEVLAIERAGTAARGATLYINLEPCCHQGRTPPCVDALLAAGLARVVVGMRDPNPLVSGGGLERLRAAGIRVDEGLLADDCRRLNEQFARYAGGGVFVTLKGAMTLDGRIAAPEVAAALAAAGTASGSEPSRRFTGKESLAYVHRLRHAHDALVTGVGTVLVDDPMLTDRSGSPRRRPLLRVVVDSRLRLPASSQLVKSAKGDLLVVCSEAAIAEASNRAAELRDAGAEVVALPGRGHAGRPAPADVLKLLRERQVLGVLLEAGAQMNASALEADVVDKLVLFYAPRLLGGQEGLPLFGGRGFRTLDAARSVKIADIRRLGDDVVIEGYLRED